MYIKKVNKVNVYFTLAHKLLHNPIQNISDKDKYFKTLISGFFTPHLTIQLS